VSDSVVEFDIAPEVADLIRERGGHLWIWATDDGWPYGAPERPDLDTHWAEWRVYEHEDLLVHVDRAIVPPRRWFVWHGAEEERRFHPWWNGLDPTGVFGRVPFVTRPARS
jgi:hypothetical protein